MSRSGSPLENGAVDAGSKEERHERVLYARPFRRDVVRLIRERQATAEEMSALLGVRSETIRRWILREPDPAGA